MANITDDERKKKLMATLPKDGSAVGNKYVMGQLKWDSGMYFKLRDELVSESKLQSGRGRGGSIRLSSPDTTPQERKQKKRPAERELYPHFLRGLEDYSKAEGWTSHVIQQTSDQGSRRTGGRFTRPDFVIIGFNKYEYTPGVVRDIETFEVKPLGAPIESVFETAAHSRFATKSYLALQVAENNPTEDELGRMEAECQRFGVGLITFKSPDSFQDWEYRIDPVRTEPDPELVEQFIRDQVSLKYQEQIRKWW